MRRQCQGLTFVMIEYTLSPKGVIMKYLAKYSLLIGIGAATGGLIGYLAQCIGPT